MFLHLQPRLDFPMSIKTFLNKTLQNLKTPENASPDDTIGKLEDETLFLGGAKEALQAVGATAEQRLVENTQGLFRQKIALIDAHQKLAAEIDAFNDAQAE